MLGNYIGTDSSGTGLFPNDAVGIEIVNSSNNIIGGTQSGARNVIAGHRDSAEHLLAATVGNTILGNSMSANGGLGIDLGADGLTPNDAKDADEGANNLQNFPVLAHSPSGPGVLDVTLNSTPHTAFVVHFYTTQDNCDPGSRGQGAALIGSASVTSNDSGNVSFTFTGPIEANVTATATNAGTGDTSEFSPCASASQNRGPTANAGADQSVNAGDTVQLDGDGSTDPDGDDLTYAWSLVSRPAGSAAALSNPASVTPTFVADAPGTFTVQLIVNDGTTDSAPDRVEIHTNGPPIANAGPDQIVRSGRSFGSTAPARRILKAPRSPTIGSSTRGRPAVPRSFRAQPSRTRRSSLTSQASTSRSSSSTTDSSTAEATSSRSPPRTARRWPTRERISPTFS